MVMARTRRRHLGAAARTLEGVPQGGHLVQHHAQGPYVRLAGVAAPLAQLGAGKAA